MKTQKKVAWVFPGQGSQVVGMGKSWLETYPYIKDFFQRADDRLKFSLSNLMWEGPEAELVKTYHAQPAILTLSVAIAHVLEKEFGIQPNILAGHSLGEYSALVIADVLTFEDAVYLVHCRGKYMQEAVPLGVGAMSAVLGLEDNVVEAVCDEVSQVNSVVEPANFNCPGQLVISGHISAIERAEVALKEKGAKRCIRLQVSAPFHSTLLEPAGEKLLEQMKSIAFKAPKIPYIANVSAEEINAPDQIIQSLADQVWNPVRWTQSVQKIQEKYQPIWVEVGPGKALQGLVKKSARADAVIACTNTPAEFDRALVA